MRTSQFRSTRKVYSATCLRKSKIVLKCARQSNVSYVAVALTFLLASFVEVLKIEFICPERPKGRIVLNLQKKEGDDTFNVKEVYVLKEKTINCMQLTFKVHNDIVFGLKYFCIVKKKGITVSKDEEVLGSFSPTIEAHVV